MNRRSMKSVYFSILCLVLVSWQSVFAQKNSPEGNDSLLFQGQLSAWGHYNANNSYPFAIGGRYLPQLNYQIELPKSRLIDFEASANLYGDAGFKSFESVYTNGKIKPYRAWVRYSSHQFEIRVGLQKINFGSATLLRPLMWFDRIDARDPLRLTNGVYAALARYYFLNNINLWVWALYGNNHTKGWEIIKTNANYPELGGHFQWPVPKGEAALSFNHRIADSRELNGEIPIYDKISENKIGFDTKLDLGFGCWFEGSWVSKNKDLGKFTNQEMINLGIDYTLGIGNGLNINLEHLIASYDKHAFAFANATNFTGLSANYPIGIIDNLQTIIYYDWSNKSLYSFVNWYRQYDAIRLYFMAYWNPVNYQINFPLKSGNLYAGKGIQIMIVFNH